MKLLSAGLAKDLSKLDKIDIKKLNIKFVLSRKKSKLSKEVSNRKNQKRNYFSTR